MATLRRSFLRVDTTEKSTEQVPRTTIRRSPGSGERAVERRVDVQGGAREHRQLAVGLLDQQLDLGAAEEQPLGSRVPELVDEGDHAATGGVLDAAVDEL